MKQRQRPPSPSRRILARLMSTSAARSPDSPHEPGRGALQPVPPGAPPASHGSRGGDGEDYKLGLEILRGLAEQELGRAEVARSRSRQSFALAAGFFAVVQTVAFGSFVTEALSKSHETATLIHHVTVAAIALAVSAVFAVVAELAFPSRDLAPESALGIVQQEPPTDNSVLVEFTERYAMIALERQETNRRRGWAVALTQLSALIAIALSVLELLVSLHASL